MKFRMIFAMALASGLVFAATRGASAFGATFAFWSPQMMVAPNVADVFSVDLYTGTNAARSIGNGVNLSGEGGLVWMKARSSSYPGLYDTVRGITKGLSTPLQNAQQTDSPGTGLTAFNGDGFSLANNHNFLVNSSGTNYVAWTFRKAPRFFDIVTYTGNGTTQTLSHNLGITPGMIVVKRLDGTSDWTVWHRSLTPPNVLLLNSTAAQTNTSGVNKFGDNSVAVSPTSTGFTIGSFGEMNASGGSYVAYLFAHDPDPSGVIQCGSYLGTGSIVSVTLGWQPQYILARMSGVGVSDAWYTGDTARGWAAGNDLSIAANSNSGESSRDLGAPTATGFQTDTSNLSTAGRTHIYCAIRAEVCTDPGATWTARTDPGTGNWYGFASSADGTKLVTGNYNGYIYTSTDSGATWTQRTGPGTGAWFAFASSSDGTKLVTGKSSGGYIYTSADSGATWTERTGPGTGTWYGFASSSDGTKLVTGNYNGYIYTSTNSGATWTARTGPGTSTWVSFASSADGTKLVTGDNGGYIYTSTDSGATWTQRTGAGTGTWYGFASSSDGTKLATVKYAGNIYTSTDSGVTWTERTGPGTGNWRAIAGSADGTKLVTAKYGGYIYTSTDSGVTWTERTGPGTGNWRAFASSSDGAKLVTGNPGGNIYTSTCP